MTSFLPNQNSPLALALRRIHFYRWAYGDIGEADSEIGILGEYVVGNALDCLPRKRSVTGEYDLTLADGRTIEVKTSCRPRTEAKLKGRCWTWLIRDQRRALEGRSKMADWWIFIKVEMPEKQIQRRLFNPFDDRWYMVYLLPGSDLQALGLKRKISESTLIRARAIRCTIEEMRTHLFSDKENAE